MFKNVIQISLITAALALAMPVMAEVTSKTFELKNFTGVDSSGAFDLDITCGKKQTVTITTEEKQFEDIKVKVKDGKLVLEQETGFFKSSKDVKVKITMGMLDSIELSGSGDIDARDVDSKELAIVISGAADIDLKGKAKVLDVMISGSGEVEAKELEADTVRAKISGSGDLEVNAKKELDVKVSGSGSVDYYGSPTKVNTKVTGSGTVQRKG